MTWTSVDAHPLARAAAKLVGAFALGCALALSLAGGGSSPAKASSPGPRAIPTASHLADTRAGASAAATAWCQQTAEAFITGRWDSAVNALATGAFRTLALRYQSVSALVSRRLEAARTPYALRVWPLGYAIERYSPTRARVRVWQLYVLAVSGPEADTEFTTTTVTLQWSSGAWKVSAAPPGADLAPPGRNATPDHVAIWIRAANRLDGYAYVP